MEKSVSTEQKNYWWLIVITIFTPIGIILIVHSNKNLSEAGQIGDSFGIATSIYTGITIIGLLITIRMQREDLRIARMAFQKQSEELELTREQIKISNKEFEQQNITLKNQRFESTFFNMLQLHERLIEKLSKKGLFESVVGHCQTSLKGMEDFRSLQSKYRSDCQSLVRIHMSQYIRNFQKLIELIYQFKKDKETIQKYLGIYFAQLSQLELELICYHFNLKDTMHPEYYSEYKELFFGYISANSNNFHALEAIKREFFINVPYDSLLGSYSFKV